MGQSLCLWPLVHFHSPRTYTSCRHPCVSILGSYRHAPWPLTWKFSFSLKALTHGTWPLPVCPRMACGPCLVSKTCEGAEGLRVQGCTRGFREASVESPRQALGPESSVLYLSYLTWRNEVSPLAPSPYLYQSCC